MAYPCVSGVGVVVVVVVHGRFGLSFRDPIVFWFFLVFF
jgi:hypothetical protein